MAYQDILKSPIIISGNLALYLEWPDNEPVEEDGEKWQVLIFDGNGTVLFLSPIVSPLVARGFRHKFYTYLRGTAYVTIIHYSTYRGVSGAGRATLKLPISNLWFFANGKTEVIINMSDLVGSPSGQKAKRASSSKVNPASARNRTGTKSSIRPNELVRIPVMTGVDRKDNWTGAWYKPTPPVLTQWTSHVRNWTGVRTPGFGRLKRSLLPVNPHTVSIRDTPFTYNITITLNSMGYANISYTWFTNVYPSAPIAVHNGAAINKALSKLVGRAGVALESNIAQDFAQLGQTLNLLSGTLFRLTGSMTALVHGNVGKAADILFGSSRKRYRRGRRPSKSKSLADNWLELQYGWKPLLQDIHDSMQALKRLNESTPVVKRVTATATVKTQSNSSFENVFIPKVPVGKTQVNSTTTAKYGIRYKIDDRLKSFLAQLGFTNPVNLAWEILPFSFVVDWFIPIGPYLETLSSWDGVTFLDGYQVLITKQITDSSISFSRENAAKTVKQIERASYHDRQVIFARVKLTSFPSASVPQLKNGLKSLTHVANGLALLRSLFGK